ncbi:MAG TPA: 4'-phosphopantetheinyl transferase superfamily protein [Gemmataceae bacterium]|jgi:4'-phosphopantetheinyl transferase
MGADAWPLVRHVPLLGPDDVHVWQAALDADEPTVSRLEAILAPDERARADRFHFQRDRRRFIVGRGYLRRLLGEYLSVAPSDVALAVTSLGKPQLAGEAADRLRFNVAHSDDLALYAMTRGREVGIDVERERPDIDWRELGRRFFAPEEVAALTALPSAEQRPAFYRCWTRKEAYIKALGRGMQMPLDGFAVTLNPDTAGLVHTAHDRDQLARWELRPLTPAPGFAGAVAVEGRNWRLFCGRFAGDP